MTDTAEGRIAFIQREIAAMQARDEALRLAPRSVRRTTGASIVYSIRLDPTEVAALEARSAITGIKPTVLARNLIRTGLSAPHGSEIAAAVDRLEAAVGELRAAVS
ncbi:MAG: hypothetical protein ABI808_05140 [Pseudonocardiales bacterium]